MKQKVIFISGIPGTGKTTLSYYLGYQLSIDKILNIDTMKAIDQMFISKSESPYLYSTTHESYQIENSPYVDGFKKHCKVFCDQITDLLNHDYIQDKIVLIEGAQIIPELLNKIDSTKYETHFLTLYTKNKEFLLNRYRKKALLRPYNWIENINIILEIQDYLLKQYNTEFYDVFKSDYKERVLKRIEQLL